MEEVRAYTIRVHDDATLNYQDFEDRIEFILTNKLTKKAVLKPYYKLDTGIDILEAVKIDTIVGFMHSSIGLNIWDDGEDIKLHVGTEK